MYIYIIILSIFFLEMILYSLLSAMVNYINFSIWMETLIIQFLFSMCMFIYKGEKKKKKCWGKSLNTCRNLSDAYFKTMWSLINSAVCQGSCWPVVHSKGMFNWLYTAADAQKETAHMFASWSDIFVISPSV